MHRDMKPENLLMSSKDPQAKVKLCDFGFASHVNKEAYGDLCGTPDYVAPEMISKNPYGVQIDMWSTGVILYILLCGYAPFQAEKRSVLFQLIKKGVYTCHEQYWRHVSPLAKDFIAALLVVDPRKRLSASQALQHPWMTEKSDTLKCYTSSTENIKMFRRFNAKRKLIAAARAVIAMNRMKRLIQSISTSSKNPIHHSS
jgi:serine/threonine protein kinase